MSDPVVPEVVMDAIRLLNKDKREGAIKWQPTETSPGVWEIIALAKVCCACARIIGSATETHVIQEGAPNAEITIMPHCCSECTDAMVQGSLGITEAKRGIA